MGLDDREERRIERLDPAEDHVGVWVARIVNDVVAASADAGNIAWKLDHLSHWRASA